MSKAQKIILGICIPLCAISIIVCLFLDIWFLTLKKTGADKIISSTFKVGLQVATNEEGEETKKPFIELKYFTNENNNGLVMLDVKFNYFIDENQEDFYSQGLQFVSNNSIYWTADSLGDKDSEPYSDVILDRSLWATLHAKTYYSYTRFEPQARVYNYASQDDYVTPLISSNPITHTSDFKIQIGDDLFLMRFKGNDKLITEKNYIGRVYLGFDTFGFLDLGGVNRFFADKYAYFDDNYFLNVLFNSIQSLPRGTSQNIIFEFGDYFDYYKYNPNRTAYDDIAQIKAANNEKKPDINIFGKIFEYCSNTGHVSSLITNYYVIKVTVTADGARNSKDSLFNCIEGKSNLCSDEVDLSDYFVGKTVKTITQECFVPILVEDTKFQLKLSDLFIDKFYDYRKNMLLKIYINLDFYENSDLVFDGFVKDSFAEFEVYRAYTIKNNVITGVSV